LPLEVKCLTKWRGEATLTTQMNKTQGFGTHDRSLFFDKDVRGEIGEECSVNSRRPGEGTREETREEAGEEKEEETWTLEKIESIALEAM
jgi:hypothetical protein